MKANGKTIICKGMESIRGRMEEAIRVNIKKIKSTGTVFMPGLMEEDMRDGGTPLSSSALADILYQQMERRDSVSGKMESESNGLTNKRER